MIYVFFRCFLPIKQNKFLFSAFLKKAIKKGGIFPPFLVLFMLFSYVLRDYARYRNGFFRIFVEFDHDPVYLRRIFG